MLSCLAGTTWKPVTTRPNKYSRGSVWHRSCPNLVPIFSQSYPKSQSCPNLVLIFYTQNFKFRLCSPVISPAGYRTMRVRSVPCARRESWRWGPSGTCETGLNSSRIRWTKWRMRRNPATDACWRLASSFYFIIAYVYLVLVECRSHPECKYKSTCMYVLYW